jgi:acyl-CoA reductase-like NAD-dependent aldehyde dehydrogenase
VTNLGNFDPPPAEVTEVAKAAYSRYDPLRDAARHALDQWDQEDNQERNDLSEAFWQAMEQLRKVLESAQR